MDNGKSLRRVVQVHALTEEVYKNLVKGLPLPIVSEKTTAHEAGYLLGIQHVLGLLRKGVVIPDGN